jgi:hypothetical protein
MSLLAGSVKCLICSGFSELFALSAVKKDFSTAKNTDSTKKTALKKPAVNSQLRIPKRTANPH